MTAEEKAKELYNRLDMIIYTSHDYKAQIFACMDYFIESMINENYFCNENRLSFWEEVKKYTEKMKLKK